MSTSDNFSPAPPPPAQPSQGAGTRTAVPPSVDRASKLLLGIIALAAVSMVLTLTRLDSIVTEALEADSEGFFNEDAVRATILGGSIGFFVVTAAIASLLYIFWRKGAGWSRIVGIIVGIASAIFAIVGIFTDEAPLQMLLSLFQATLAVGIVVLLLRPDSSQFFSSSRAPY